MAYHAYVPEIQTYQHKVKTTADKRVQPGLCFGNEPGYVVSGPVPMTSLVTTNYAPPNMHQCATEKV